MYRFDSLAQRPEVLHAILARTGGTSTGVFRSLNVGAVGDDPAAVRVNHSLIFRALGIPPARVVTAHQLHGAQVAVVGRTQEGAVVPATDSLITNTPGTVLMLRFADCLPLMLYDPSRHVVALVHAGWRGVVAQVVANTVSALHSSFGCRPVEMLACLGPAIRSCCYEVRRELASKVEEAYASHNGLLLTQPDGALHFDLPAAVRRQLWLNGVHQIEDSELCTSCHTEEFFSHRAERGRTGRFAAVLALREEKGG